MDMARLRRRSCVVDLLWTVHIASCDEKPASKPLSMSSPPPDTSTGPVRRVESRSIGRSVFRYLTSPRYATPTSLPPSPRLSLSQQTKMTNLIVCIWLWLINTCSSLSSPLLATLRSSHNRATTSHLTNLPPSIHYPTVANPSNSRSRSQALCSPCSVQCRWTHRGPQSCYGFSLEGVVGDVRAVLGRARRALGESHWYPGPALRVP